MNTKCSGNQYESLQSLIQLNPRRPVQTTSLAQMGRLTRSGNVAKPVTWRVTAGQCRTSAPSPVRVRNTPRAAKLTGELGQSQKSIWQGQENQDGAALPTPTKQQQDGSSDKEAWIMSLAHNSGRTSMRWEFTLRAPDFKPGLSDE